jgi:hypothetical protein
MQLGDRRMRRRVLATIRDHIAIAHRPAAAIATRRKCQAAMQRCRQRHLGYSHTACAETLPGERSLAARMLPTEKGVAIPRKTICAIPVIGMRPSI